MGFSGFLRRLVGRRPKGKPVQNAGTKIQEGKKPVPKGSEKTTVSKSQEALYRQKIRSKVQGRAADLDRILSQTHPYETKYKELLVLANYLIVAKNHGIKINNETITSIYESLKKHDSELKKGPGLSNLARDIKVLLSELEKLGK